jgi:hypothetical protein
VDREEDEDGFLGVRIASGLVVNCSGLLGVDL